MSTLIVRVWLAALLALAAPGLAVTAAEKTGSGAYAHPELLVSTGWVAAHGADRGVRVVDMRPASAYSAGHIPGAVSFEEGPLRNPEDRLTYLPRPEALVAMLGRAGIGSGTRVIAYDDQGGKLATRLWYVLSAYGDPRVSVLNGGWTKWTAEKRPISTEPAVPEKAAFVPRESPAMSCPSPALLARKPDVIVLDARSAAEFQGRRVSPGAAAAGRVPGAVNIDWQENVTGPNLEFRSARDLRRLYTSKGVTPDRRIVVYCASGGRASHSLFVLKLLGYPHVQIYYGSFADYSTRPDAPIER